MRLSKKCFSNVVRVGLERGELDHMVTLLDGRKVYGCRDGSTFVEKKTGGVVYQRLILPRSVQSELESAKWIAPE